MKIVPAPLAPPSEVVPYRYPLVACTSPRQGLRAVRAPALGAEAVQRRESLCSQSNRRRCAQHKNSTGSLCQVQFAQLANDSFHLLRSSSQAAWLVVAIIALNQDVIFGIPRVMIALDDRTARSPCHSADRGADLWRRAVRGIVHRRQPQAPRPAMPSASSSRPRDIGGMYARFAASRCTGIAVSAFRDNRVCRAQR